LRLIAAKNMKKGTAASSSVPSGVRKRVRVDNPFVFVFPRPYDTSSRGRALKPAKKVPERRQPRRKPKNYTTQQARQLNAERQQQARASSQRKRARGD